MRICGRSGFGAALGLVLVAAVPVAARAAPHHALAPHRSIAAQRIGGAGPWSAYLYKAGPGPVCYLAGAPEKSEPARLRRRPPSLTVTHRPKENAFNVVNFDAGTTLKPGSDASVDIDGTKFDLFTKSDGAWSRTSDTDKAIVEAMVKGRSALFSGTAAKGATVTDSYSLGGFTQTLAMIDKACGVKR
ncbi:MAG: invasion associated locus B family protein [Stellaceae bacterium]